VHLDVGNSQRVRERIAGMEAIWDCSGGDRAPDLVFELLAEDPLVVIVPPGHPWARRRRIRSRSSAIRR